MARRLLDRQRSLVEFLTSNAGILDDNRDASSAAQLEGIDAELLRVEAHFSYAKRMEKIAAVLPRTFELMGAGEPEIVRAFVDRCPPGTISRLENARQFHEFLSLRWARDIPDPPYIRDVAACELACAEVEADDEDGEPEPEADEKDAARGAIRRRPNVILVRCDYDVRPIFEQRRRHRAPEKRETPLVIALPPGAERAQVFEVLPAIFGLLAALDHWTVPPAPLPAEMAQLLSDLTERGLIEVQS